MTQEKTLILDTGRSVKVIAHGIQQSEKPEVQIDVLVKEPKEDSFHPPIGLTHPKYWKLKKMDEQKSRMLQIKYSGLSDKQLRNAVKELKNLMA